jgi:protein-S-isoprenylcysteine O-methyltransferase Ste14
MEDNITTEQVENINPHKNKVHKILAHSYLFYFVSFLLSLFLDFTFPIIAFRRLPITLIGVTLLILGTILILWAQKSSFKLPKENMSKDTFYRGPYRYTRIPTHFGLFLLMLGFGVMLNALFIIIFSIISLFVTRLIFIKEEEKILTAKYGTPYIEYKKSVIF